MADLAHLCSEWHGLPSRADSVNEEELPILWPRFAYPHSGLELLAHILAYGKVEASSTIRCSGSSSADAV